MSYTVQTTKDAITVSGAGPATVRFTVTNSSDRDLETAVKLHVAGAIKTEWCRMTPAEDAVVRARDSAIYEVTLAPAGVGEPASGTVWIEAAWVQRPNEVFTQGPQVAVTLVPAGKEPSWLQKNWWILAAGGLLLAVAAVLVAVLGGTPVEIQRFVANPSSALPGSTVELQWQIKGPVADAFLLPPNNGEKITLQPAERAAGSHQLTLTWPPGDHVVQLVAMDGTEATEGKPAKRADVTITVQEPPPQVEPPKIDAFTVTPASVEAGQPVTFAWRLSGTIGRAVLDLGDGSGIEVPKDDYANGSLPRPFLPGTHRVTLRVFTADLQDKVEDTKEVQVRAAPRAATVEQFTLTGLNPKSVSVRDHRIAGAPATKRTYYDAVRVQWKVTGDHGAIKVRFGQKDHPLNGSSGSADIPMPRTTDGTVGELVVTTPRGDLVVTAKVGETRFHLKLDASRVRMIDTRLLQPGR